MVWAHIRSWFGSGSDEDKENLPQELAKVRKKVLGERKRVDSLEDNLKSAKKDIGENREALRHVIETLSYRNENGGQENTSKEIEDVKERVKGLEKRFERFVESVSTADRTSGRTSKRLDDEADDQTAVEETAQEAVEGQELWEKATNAQKRIIRAMFELGYPATYKEIASEVGKSVSTVKNHVNNLKSLGFNFAEEEGPNNSKKYSLDERLRAFMTVRLND